jgi:glucokinase
MILAGDVGGTHTRLALFEKSDLKIYRDFSSRNHAGLIEIVQAFLRSCGNPSIRCACLGVAGAVRDGRCRATNLPWIVDSEELSRILSIPNAFIINDLEANAYGLEHLQSGDLFSIHEGVRQVGNRAIVSAGTGLGEACLYWNGEGYCPFASEGGHVDFAPRDAREIELLRYLQGEFGHVSYERVISGPGLHGLYRFLIDTQRERASSEAAAAMEHRDPAAVIVERGLSGIDGACRRAVEWFLSLYGAEAGNVALKFFAIGGIFLGGGIVPHLLPFLCGREFVAAFVDKGRFRPLLETIPIWAILNDRTALLGAAAYAMRRER